MNDKPKLDLNRSHVIFDGPPFTIVVQQDETDKEVHYYFQENGTLLGRSKTKRDWRISDD